jgi:hypothetical protein
LIRYGRGAENGSMINLRKYSFNERSTENMKERNNKISGRRYGDNRKTHESLVAEKMEKT